MDILYVFKNTHLKPTERFRAVLGTGDISMKLSHIIENEVAFVVRLNDDMTVQRRTSFK